MDKLEERLVEPPLTDEDVELARRFVESARKSMLDRLPDDVIGGISKSHMIFGLACAAHAVSVLRPEAADEITRLKSEVERLTKEADDHAEAANRWRNEWGEARALIDELVEEMESGIALFSKGVAPRLDDMIDRARALISKARSPGKAGSDA